MGISGGTPCSMRGLGTGARADLARWPIGLPRRLRFGGQRRTDSGRAGKAGSFQQATPAKFEIAASLAHCSLPYR